MLSKPSVIRTSHGLLAGNLKGHNSSLLPLQFRNIRNGMDFTSND